MKKWEYKQVHRYLDVKYESTGFLGLGSKRAGKWVFNGYSDDMSAEDIFNSLGSEGWELVVTNNMIEGESEGIAQGGAGWSYTSGFLYIFKREVE